MDHNSENEWWIAGLVDHKFENNSWWTPPTTTVEQHINFTHCDTLSCFSAVILPVWFTKHGVRLSLVRNRTSCIFFRYEIIGKATRNTISYQKNIQEVRFRARDKRTPCFVDHAGRKTAGKQTSREIDAKRRYELPGRQQRFRTRQHIKKYDFVPEN